MTQAVFFLLQIPQPLPAGTQRVGDVLLLAAVMIWSRQKAGHDRKQEEKFIVWCVSSLNKATSTREWFALLLQLKLEYDLFQNNVIVLVFFAYCSPRVSVFVETVCSGLECHIILLFMRCPFTLRYRHTIYKLNFPYHTFLKSVKYPNYATSLVLPLGLVLFSGNNTITYQCANSINKIPNNTNKLMTFTQ